MPQLWSLDARIIHSSKKNLSSIHYDPLHQPKSRDKKDKKLCSSQNESEQTYKNYFFFCLFFLELKQNQKYFTNLWFFSWFVQEKNVRTFFFFLFTGQRINSSSFLFTHNNDARIEYVLLKSKRNTLRLIPVEGHVRT